MRGTSHVRTGRSTPVNNITLDMNLSDFGKEDDSDSDLDPLKLWGIRNNKQDSFSSFSFSAPNLTDLVKLKSPSGDSNDDENDPVFNTAEFSMKSTSNNNIVGMASSNNNTDKTPIRSAGGKTKSFMVNSASHHDLSSPSKKHSPPDSSMIGGLVAPGTPSSSKYSHRDIGKLLRVVSKLEERINSLEDTNRRLLKKIEGDSKEENDKIEKSEEAQKETKEDSFVGQREATAASPATTQEDAKSQEDATNYDTITNSNTISNTIPDSHKGYNNNNGYYYHHYQAYYTDATNTATASHNHHSNHNNGNNNNTKSTSKKGKRNKHQNYTGYSSGGTGYSSGGGYFNRHNHSYDQQYWGGYGHNLMSLQELMNQHQFMQMQNYFAQQQMLQQQQQVEEYFFESKDHNIEEGNATNESTEMAKQNYDDNMKPRSDNVDSSDHSTPSNNSDKTSKDASESIVSPENTTIPSVSSSHVSLSEYAQYDASTKHKINERLTTLEGRQSAMQRKIACLDHLFGPTLQNWQYSSKQLITRFGGPLNQPTVNHPLPKAQGNMYGNTSPVVTSCRKDCNHSDDYPQETSEMREMREKEEASDIFANMGEVPKSRRAKNRAAYNAKKKEKSKLGGNEYI